MIHFRYILLLIFSFVISVNSIAQDDIYYSPPKQKSKKKKSKTNYKINSGFVFIDGKYIEPPYRIKKHRNKITINGVKVVDTKRYRNINRPKYKKTKRHPGYPPDTITYWKRAISYINKKTGNTFMSDVVSYAYDNFERRTAQIIVEDFLKSLPSVEKGFYTKGKGYTIKPINKDTVDYIVWESSLHGSILRPKLKKYSRSQINKQCNIQKNNIIDGICSVLKRGGVNCFNKNRQLPYQIYNKVNTEYFINKVIPIINNNNLNDKEKISEIKKTNIQNIPPLEIIRTNIIISNSLKSRIRKTKKIE